MTISTLLGYLIGRRRAVLRTASCRGTVWLGLLFVLSAGFTREYDREDLLHEPWHLLLPLGASLATSFVLFCLIFAIARRRGVREGTFWGLYGSFLALYWMTAPLAWLYAVPYERFLSAADATAANLWTLGFVSVWRVLLITRAISVLFRAPACEVFVPVMLFADSLALVLLFATPLPIIQIMGGVDLTASEELLGVLVLFIGLFGFVAWPLLLLGTLLLLVVKPAWEWRLVLKLERFLPVVLDRGSRNRHWRLALKRVPRKRRVSRPLWGLAAFAVLGWAFVLPVTQPEQQLRRQAEHDLRSGRIREALELMSAHERSDFPPHWDPPPRPADGRRRPALIDVMEVVMATDPAPWVRDVYVRKLEQEFIRPGFWNKVGRNPGELSRLVSILEGLPERTALLHGKAGSLRQFADRGAGELPPPLIERIRALIDEAESSGDPQSGDVRGRPGPANHANGRE